MVGLSTHKPVKPQTLMSKILDQNLSLFLPTTAKRAVESRKYSGRKEILSRDNTTSSYLRVSIKGILLFAFFALLMLYTSLAWCATISGKVEIDGRKDLSGVLVTAQEASLSSITDVDGIYSIGNISPGSYTLIVQKAGCLVEVYSDVVVGSSPVTVNFQLIPGDLKMDNQINLLDRIMLTSAWQARKGAPNWNDMLDMYEDGVIDEKDRDLLLSHWKKGNASIKLGSMEVLSEPEGATILINGANTEKVTPYTFYGMVVGRYNITLSIAGYPDKQASTQIKANETASLDLILDDQPPEFTDWKQDPQDLTEDTQQGLRVTVKVVDKGGSGLEGKIPQFDYHIGADTTYDGYEDMTQGGADTWYYEIERPVESWNAYRGKYVYYKVKAGDVAGNEAESEEQREPIDDINDLPVVRITSTFNSWERGLLTIEAEASDTDGTIGSVLFEYSFDNSRWTKIGSEDTTHPYSAPWDTTQAVREVVKNVWIRATATDDDGGSKQDTTASFGVDNQPPVASHDYDGEWHNKDFVITLESDDGDGIGVASISYILNYGTKQDVLINGQASAPVRITTESHVNVLEYWSEDKLGNEASHKTLSDIKLDKSAPMFSDWQKSPANLTEDSTEMFRVSVQVSDGDGSGFNNQIPQIDYYTGREAQYNGYEDMSTADGKVWYFNIPEPADTWNAHRGEYVHYRVRSTDIAGNVREVEAPRELIDDINDPPVVSLTSRFNVWQKGMLTLQAEASDTDGVIAGVQFEYSLDKSAWIPIGSADTEAPFSVEWDTASSITEAQFVWIQAVATDDSGASASSTYPTSIGIDNQSPVTFHDYDGKWHTADFAIVLTVSDGDGIGVPLTKVKYRINDGSEKNLSMDGQPWIAEEGINRLEYWSADDLGNEENRQILPNIKLDKTKPEFMDWLKDPDDLTEDSKGSLLVSVRVIDKGGSGLENKVPQFSYRIGRTAQYNQYENMAKGEDVWYYEIPEPGITWDAYRGEYVYYKVKAADVAGNVTESVEQKELVDDINDYPTVRIKTRFTDWQSGTLTIEADSTDSDGWVSGVQFEYSLNRVVWTAIGALDTSPPYSTSWNTKLSIPEVAKQVWIKATSTDDDNNSIQDTTTDSFSVDNQPPTTTDDYNGAWRTKDFVINLKPGDGDGIGVRSVSYRFNYGTAQEVSLDSKITIPVNITAEGADNILEYWATDKLGNEGSHKTLTDIKLDKTAPVFSNWQQDPVNLTEDTVGRFRVSVDVTDTGGSGLSGKFLQIDYHIGTETQYDGYENMAVGSWYFDIPEPENTWNAYINKYVYYKVRIEDVAGNVAASPERTELIDSVNDAPVVNITSIFPAWVGGKITITATASDVDGSVPVVNFEYSVNATTWLPLGITSPSPPVYSVEWDTKAAIPTLEKSVWVKAKAIDADDNKVIVENIISKSFGIDNQAPTLSNWTQLPANLTEDIRGVFRVQVNVDDGVGSGVASVLLSYRIGENLVIRTSREMTKGTGNLWYYDIPEPTKTWDGYRGEILYYSAHAIDVVANESPETMEQQELIDDINDPPRGIITSTFKDWERGILTIRANAVDDDGNVTGVQFQYSADNANWLNIGSVFTTAPYTVTWDTTGIKMDPDVWVQVVVTDDDSASTKVPYAKSIGIDNTLPVFAKWNHTDLTEDSAETFFRVEVEITDQGSGVDSTKVQLDYRIGAFSGYTGYRNMFRGTGNIWFYEIPRPGPWSIYAGQTLFYRVKADDIAGNTAESEEQKELIEPTTGSISGTIQPRESWAANAKVTAQQNNVAVKQVSVSLVNGSYSITGLRPGVYNLVVTAQGYGTDTSMTNIQVVAGQDSPNHNVTLYTYTVAQLTRAQGGSVVYTDSQLKEYKLIIGSNVLGKDGKVVLGMSGKEPTSVPNPEVELLGRSVGIGYEGKSLSGPLQVIMPRPTGISDSNAVMTFIYDGKAQSYRFVDRNSIALSDLTVTITVTPEDLWSFSDDTHDFNNTLSRTADTVFYVLITEFNEPSLSSSQLGILDPQIGSGRITSYNQPTVAATDVAIAVVVHGITSTPNDMVNVISDLRAMNYYNRVWVFNYDPKNSISSSGDLLRSKLAEALPASFTGKVDIVAHCMGGLVARRAIVSGGDDEIGSLVMLGVPHGGVDDRLLRAGFASFLLTTPSNPTWSYYRTGWRDMLAGSTFLLALNSQSGKQVDTHYYGIGASNPGAATDNDDLAYMASMDFTTGFANMEQPLTEAFEEVVVSLPATAGPGFMSRTRHVAMLNSTTVRGKVTSYLQGKSRNIRYQKYTGELIPGTRLAAFKVELKNVGTQAVQGVTARLSTQNSYIRKYSGVQGIENNTSLIGDIAAGATVTGTFSFDVSSSAAFGSSVTFKLTITNSGDNSIFQEEFVATIGGNMIKISAPGGVKMVTVNVSKLVSPLNDGDPAVEPGEIMEIAITLLNQAAATIDNVTATLKSADSRVEGRDASGNPVNLVNTGLVVSYGSFFAGASKSQTFRFVKINDNFTPLGDLVHFTLELKSGGIFIGNDEFDVKVGADIIATSFAPDEELEPGRGPQDIEVYVKNITSSGVNNVTVTLDYDDNEVVLISGDENDINITVDEVDISSIQAANTGKATFEAQINAGFAGYVVFTVEIEVNNVLINVERFRDFFGRHAYYATSWTVDDDNNNAIPEPGEDIDFQIALWNLTDETVTDVEAFLDTADSAIITPLDEERGDYDNIAAHETRAAKDKYEFAVADAGNRTYPAGNGSVLTATTLTLATATWIPDAFIGGRLTLNPSTTPENYTITDNDETTLTVNLAGTAAANGDPFNITMPTTSPFTDFQRKGRTVQFALNVEEDNETMGQESISLRIGGMIRHLPAASYSDLMGDLSDRASLDPTKNDGDGIPELGETIEMDVTLINIWNDEIQDIEAQLTENSGDIDFPNNGDEATYGDINDGDTLTRKFTFKIDPSFEGKIITFRLSIRGDVNGSSNADLGTDVFTIPVGR